ncbi:helix-turn-helix domain-containing protein [Sphingomonas baiyangensis]|uniref:Helix-turn-helix domain-containing protein n=1 Tax=Sphingomonas baiyangensis TaxID=2572576 RepID=A0A4U1L1I5_9SPHN|nr:helix-turn-helix domain-containing protein [Sphingomonas baiyangensis]TKD50030.1 helix-turn-helix domain-containing protein [Sphingomonas baiyangensis]
MMDTPDPGTGGPSTRTGDRLRDAREAQGLTLADIAQRTRIPLRHLESIEASTYASLPSITYAMGFARAYARAVGLDEVAIARDLRAELATTWQQPPRHEPYDPSEPARVPPRGIAMAGLAVFVLLLAGMAIWYGSNLFRGDGGRSTAAAPAPTQAVAPAPAPTQPVASQGGQVTLVAADEVWVRVYTAGDETLLTRTMQPGERFDVPRDADGPMVNVGRPEALKVLVDGREMAPLGPAGRAVSDVPIGAAALRARASGG